MPQNVPGTSSERAQLAAPADYGIEDFSRMPQIEELFRQIDRLRKPATASPAPAREPQPREFKEVEP